MAVNFAVGRLVLKPLYIRCNVLVVYMIIVLCIQVLNASHVDLYVSIYTPVIGNFPN